MIANELKNGKVIELNGELYSVTNYTHIKPGKGPAYIRCKLKDLKRSKIIEKTFRSTEKVTPAILEERKANYLYRQGEEYHFMDNENFEEIIIDENIVREKKNFLKESITFTLLEYKEKLIDLIVPTFVDLKVTKAEAGIKGNTATSVKKRVTLETNFEIDVPLFINQGDLVRVDTRTGKYVTRL